MHMLLILSGHQVYRVKGILNFEGSNEKMIFQSVRSSVQMEKGSAWSTGEKRQSKIVFIGYNVKRAPIEKGLEGCFHKS
jgi:G3E family GTPase